MSHRRQEGKRGDELQGPLGPQDDDLVEDNGLFRIFRKRRKSEFRARNERRKKGKTGEKNETKGNETKRN